MTKLGRPTAISNGQRRCAKCKVVKDILHFDYRSQGGMKYLSSYCRGCEKIRFRERTDEIKERRCALLYLQDY